MAKKGKKSRIDTDADSEARFQAFDTSTFAGLESLAPAPAEPAEDETSTTSKATSGQAILRKETSNRGGKAVIVIDEFEPLPTEDELKDMATALRKSCGVGGAVKDHTIELQGNQPEKVRSELRKLGYSARGLT